MADELTLLVKGSQVQLRGWTDIRVTRGIERFPSDFEIHMTELFPPEMQAVVVQPGDACQVKLGNDVVVTGYIDVFEPTIDPAGHVILISGRGKCQDLVDCSAEWPGGQISNNTVLQIAQKLAKKYNIDAIAGPQADIGAVIPQTNLTVLEAPYDILERMCRYRGLLLYENADGNLVLDGVGTTYHASGLKEGVNVQRATARYSMNGRYSNYRAFIQAMDMLDDVGMGWNELADIEDKAVPRHRAKAIVAESSVSGLDICIRRAVWDYARQIGRSNALTLTCDSWRDSAGELWQPNKLVPLYLPSLRIGGKTPVVGGVNYNDWLINEVTYSRNAQTGTTAELLLMPQQAFIPEPIAYQPLARDVEQALGKAGL